MQILLTGGSGFIGRNIKESYLAKKYHIIAPCRQELDLNNQLSVENYFKDKRFDVVIHAAGKPGHRNALDQSNLLNTNLRMFNYLVKQRAKFAKFINLGSGAIYDLRNYQPKMREEYAGVSIPLDEHGLCKYIVDQQIQQLDGFVDLRIFGIFGAYEDYAIRFISNAICKTLYNLPISLIQNRRFAYLYIADLMPILDYFIQNSVAHHAYNITPDISVELLEIVKVIAELSHKDLSIVLAKPGMGMEYTGDNTRLKMEMPLLHFTPLKLAITELCQWYQQHKSRIDYQQLLVDK